MDSVHVLTDARDLTACQHFVTLYGPSGAHPITRWTAYRIRNHYYVAFRHEYTDGILRTHYTPMVIFDRDLNQVIGLAM